MDLFHLQIFLDMAVLVEAQGELLDNIETQVGCQTFLGSIHMCLLTKVNIPVTNKYPELGYFCGLFPFEIASTLNWLLGPTR